MTTAGVFGKLWSQGARDWASFVEPQYRVLYEAVHDRLGVRSGMRLLDVGCGPGGAALLAAGRGARVAGLDASPDSIEMARERNPAGDFRVGDMESLPWPESAFDAVTGFNSFPFAASPVAALAEARRVLVGDGKLGIVVFLPPEKSQQTRIMAAIAALAPPLPPGGPGPFALSAPGALESALQAAGLRSIDAGEFPIVMSFPDAEMACKAFLAEVRARSSTVEKSASSRRCATSWRVSDWEQASTGSRTALGL